MRRWLAALSLCVSLVFLVPANAEARKASASPLPSVDEMQARHGLQDVSGYGTTRFSVPYTHPSLRTSRSLAGVVAPLAAKVREIQAACGSTVMSAVRHTRIRGSGNLSLHASGRAVDVAGNPSCIYAHLRDWAGGYSTDYHSVRCHRGKPCPHVHISYGGFEDGKRFVHAGSRKHRKARSRRAGT